MAENAPRMMADVWLLYDRGKVGSRHQCIGVGQALGLPYDLKQIDFPPFLNCAPYTWFETLFSASYVFDHYGLGRPWPKVIIASGRKSVGLAARLKKINPLQMRVAILQKPRQNLELFDVVVCPQHDVCPQAPHVLKTLGSLHHLTEQSLKDAQKIHLPPFGFKPRIVVLLGAPPTDTLTLQAMVRSLQMWRINDVGECVALQILASRRTPDVVMSTLQQAFGEGVDLWSPSSPEPNPYLASLVYAEKIIVTGDSVNMLTESCYTGKPVYIWTLGQYRAKFQRFHQQLVEGGHAQFVTPMLKTFKAAPLREVERIISALSQHLL